MSKHPIARLPFEMRRLFAHEALAVARVVHEVVKTPVVCEPAKIVGLALVLFALGGENGTEAGETSAEAAMLIQTLENELMEPDARLLRVLVTSMRANPSEDALDRGDVIDLDSADGAGLPTDDVIRL